MSIYINDVAVTMFDPMVKQAYQEKGFKLRNAVRMRNNVVGATVKFPKLGKGVASQKALQDDVALANLQWTDASVTLQNWNASDMSDIFGQAEVNFDEKRELAESLGLMIGRRSDQMIIDALENSSTANTVAAGGTGFTFDKFLAQNKFHTTNSTRTSGKMHIAIEATAEQDILNDSKFIDSDFTKKEVLDRGATLDGIEMFGYTWHVFGTMAEGGIPFSTPTYSAFSWNEDALGMGVGIDFRTTVDWVAMKRSYLVSCDYKANAVAIDAVGIVQIDYV